MIVALGVSGVGCFESIVVGRRDTPPNWEVSKDRERVDQNAASGACATSRTDQRFSLQALTDSYNTLARDSRVEAR